MADRIVSIWTCDRCGEEQENPSGGQPTGWAGVIIVHPPKASPDTDRARRVHLCGECDHDIGFFLNPPATEATS